jgi:hypothetical protein
LTDTYWESQTGTVAVAGTPDGLSDNYSDKTTLNEEFENIADGYYFGRSNRDIHPFSWQESARSRRPVVSATEANGGGS